MAIPLVYRHTCTGLAAIGACMPVVLEYHGGLACSIYLLAIKLLRILFHWLYSWRGHALIFGIPSLSHYRIYGPQKVHLTNGSIAQGHVRLKVRN